MSLPRTIPGVKNLRALAFRVDGTSTGLKEISTVQTVADVAGSLNDTYFKLYSANDATQYHVAINVNGAGTYTPPVGVTLVSIAVATNASADTVAAAIQVAIDALADFVATVLTDTVTITNAAKGTATNIAQGTASTGFTLTVVQGGTASTISMVEGSRDAVLTEGADDKGDYTLTFSSPFAAVPSVIPTPLTANRYIQVHTVGVSSVRIKTFQTSNVTLNDCDFHLMVVGRR